MTLGTSPGEGLGLMWRVRGLETGPDWSILLMIVTWPQLGPALFPPLSPGENKLERQNLQVNHAVPQLAGS